MTRRESTGSTTFPLGLTLLVNPSGKRASNFPTRRSWTIEGLSDGVTAVSRSGLSGSQWSDQTPGEQRRSVANLSSEVRYRDVLAGVDLDGQLNPNAGFTGLNLFTYCGNNPVNRSDSSGCNFLNDAIKWFAQAATDTRKWLVQAYSDTGEAISKAARESADAYYKSKRNEIETYQNIGDNISKLLIKSMTNLGEAKIVNSKGQMDASRVVSDFVQNRFSTPEKTKNTLSAIAWTLDAGAIYCAGIAVGLSLPSFGLSVVSAGTAVVLLGIVSLPFHAAVVIIDICNEE